MRRMSIAVVLVALAACGDDVGSVSGDDSSGSSGTTTTADTTTSATTTASTTTTSATASSTTVADESSSSTTIDPTEATTDTGSSSTTGEPGEPLGDPIAVQLGVELDPLSLEVGDFDGDDAVDLLIAGTDTGVVAAATLLGDGAGGFAAATDAGITACSAFPVVGTIDRDASADLFFGTCGVDMVFFRGAAGGVFEAASPLGAWDQAAIVASAFADQGGDGATDLVLLTTAGGNALHLATADQPGPWPVTSVSLALPGFSANRMRVADVDGDDQLDAVLVDGGVGVVTVRDVFGVAETESFDLGVLPWAAQVVDLDGDGALDLAVASLGAREIRLLQGDGAGGFAEYATVDTGDLSPFDFVFAELDGDGDVDLAFVDDDSPTLVYALGDGAGRTVVGGMRTLSDRAVRLHAVDLDGSGTADLVAATFASGTVDVLLSQ